MFKKSIKKFTIFFFASIFIMFFVFPFLQASALEIDYPTLATGAKITTESSLSEYLKYVFDFGIFIGFFFVLLSLIWAGVLYFLSPAIPGALADAKDRVSGAITGLLILALLYLIIVTLNPYLAIFRTDKLEAPPPVEPDTSAPGVNFYKSKDCSGIASSHLNSVPDLGDLKNKVYSVSISQSTQDKTYYIAVLYDVANFWGKCQYVNPNTECSTVQPFAASASIYKFDFSPKGDGVYVYRKPLNQVPGEEENKKGGYLKISNSKIISARGSGFDLRQLRFTDPSAVSRDNPDGCTVPETERDCAKYDEKGKCIKKECPKLGEENISSISIAGNYLVLLIYFSPGDSSKGPWTYCQSYSSALDINKDGPQQIKWDPIRNNLGQHPNFIIIIPVMEK